MLQMVMHAIGVENCIQPRMCVTMEYLCLSSLLPFSWSSYTVVVLSANLQQPNLHVHLCICPMLLQPHPHTRCRHAVTIYPQMQVEPKFTAAGCSIMHASGATVRVKAKGGCNTAAGGDYRGLFTDATDRIARTINCHEGTGTDAGEGDCIGGDGGAEGAGKDGGDSRGMDTGSVVVVGVGAGVGELGLGADGAGGEGVGGGGTKAGGTTAEDPGRGTGQGGGMDSVGLFQSIPSKKARSHRCSRWYKRSAGLRLRRQHSSSNVASSHLSGWQGTPLARIQSEVWAQVGSPVTISWRMVPTVHTSVARLGVRQSPLQSSGAAYSSLMLMESPWICPCRLSAAHL